MSRSWTPPVGVTRNWTAHRPFRTALHLARPTATCVALSALSLIGACGGTIFEPDILGMSDAACGADDASGDSALDGTTDTRRQLTDRKVWGAPSVLA
jgi:hypothetical protein